VVLYKNSISQKTLELLINLADEAGLSQAIKAYFSGEKINETEGRAVLHTALRSKGTEAIALEGQNVIPEVNAVKEKMYAFAERVISGDWKGHTGKSIDTIVNIGIGGSDLGPAMVTEALEFYGNHLTPYFVSNVEGDHHQELLKKINPETTLFLIVSKTFTTQETLANANSIRKWFLSSAPESAIAQHFVAVSTNLEKIDVFGIAPENVFPMNDWVGGRFSLWSTVGLSICLAVGPENFEQLLQGAGAMDRHFRDTPAEKNIPTLLALLSVWYNNFWQAESEAIVPYTQYLRNLPAYLQQGIMESNGKGVDRNGKAVDYQTGTIIWGASGTNAQHAFFQLIHQGTKLIPTDFIGFQESLHETGDHQDKLLSNFIAQTEALMCGKTEAVVRKELEEKGLSAQEIDRLTPFKVFTGNRPTTTFLIQKLTPYTLGALIAMYEHKIFVQGIIWNIYSYDQWGVELGKQLANSVLSDLQSDTLAAHDPSTIALIERCKGN
jgi:glucose-6-phosphate isomerase